MLVLLLVLSCTMAVAATDTPLQITATEWAQPRSGERLLHHPALVAVVHQLQSHPGAALEIRYPGGDNGSLWARELQAWLVALGIESARIHLLPGSKAADLLQMRVR